MEQRIEHKDIFLDFLGPDMWKTIPTFIGGKKEEKIRILSQSLNIAVLLTAEACILPPAFVAQSQLTREVMQEKVEFLSNRLILFPLKESSLDEYFEKKQREYWVVKDSHSEFYKKGGQRFLGKHTGVIIPRKASMGRTIAESWKNASDDSKLWLPIVQCAPALSDKIREIPTILKDEGISVTLEAVKKQAEINNRQMDFAINQAIQHEYLEAYLEEYNLAIIEDIPPKPKNFNFLIETGSLFYKYFVFKSVLEVLGISDYLHRASAETIVKIRHMPDYVAFINLYLKICSTSKDHEEIKWYFSELMRQIPTDKLKVSPFSAILGKDCDNQKIHSIFNAVLEKSEVTAFDTEKMYWKKQIKEKPMEKTKIFIVHGHDDLAKLTVARSLEKMGFEAIILHEQPDGGKTIIEKIEAYSDVAFAVVLYTECDVGREKTKPESENQYRARQNVVFEHGYLISKLGRDHVCALIKGNVEVPGDISGIIYTSMDKNEWEMSLYKNMKAVGINVDMNRLC